MRRLVLHEEPATARIGTKADASYMVLVGWCLAVTLICVGVALWWERRGKRKRKF